MAQSFKGAWDTPPSNSAAALPKGPPRATPHAHAKGQGDAPTQPPQGPHWGTHSRSLGSGAGPAPATFVQNASEPQDMSAQFSEFSARGAGGPLRAEFGDEPRDVNSEDMPAVCDEAWT